MVDRCTETYKSDSTGDCIDTEKRGGIMYDTIIIGSGPAGLTAAIYGERARLKTLTLEKQPMSGGQILNTCEVDNYPGLPGLGGFDLGMKLRGHADGIGAQIVTETVNAVELTGKIKKIVTDKNTYETKTVVIATGAGYRRLGVPGEKELRGMGVSYCATCDGAFFRGKDTLVVGGGDVALEDALFLARGCRKVYLVHRRDAFRGAKVLQEKVFATENIEIIPDTEVSAVNGNGKVDNASLYHKKTDSRSELAVDGVFVAVGLIPHTELFQGQVAMDADGYIKAGEDCVTRTEGVFAAGDVRTKQLRQVVTAAADGANAITSVEHYLSRQEKLS